MKVCWKKVFVNKNPKYSLSLGYVRWISILVLKLKDLTHLTLMPGSVILRLDVDGRIILRWIFRKWEGVVGTGWSWLRIWTVGGHL